MPLNNELKDLYEQIREKKNQSLEYNQFLEALKQANEKIDELHKTRTGAHPFVTKDDKTRLDDLFSNIGKMAEQVMQNEVDGQLRDMVGKVADLASSNYKIMNDYDPDLNPKTLPDLMEDARAITLDTRGAKLKATLGAKLSRRQPLTFVDPKGKVISDVFTPETIQNTWQDAQGKLDALAETMEAGEAKDMVKGFLDASYAYVKRSNRDLEEKGSKSLNFICEESASQAAGKVDKHCLERFLKKVYAQKLEGRDPEEVLGQDVLKKMARALDSVFITANVNGECAGIKDGSRLDSRNSAMSAVADLLNLSSIIARSKPMKIKNENGEIIEGTFMEEAHGIDVSNPSPKAAKYGKKSLSDTDGRGFKSIADLQILDYICGNVDRHSANVFYQFDSNGKFIGVQGVDNDAAFGTLVPEGGEGELRMVGPENMKAVSESTYKAVMKLDPQTLRFVLRGHGLSEEELNAAGNRLLHLKEELNKGVQRHLDSEANRGPNDPKFKKNEIVIIKDDEWKDLKKKDLDEVTDRKDGENYFERTIYEVTNMKQTYKDRKKDFEKLASDIAIGESNRAIDGGLDRGQAQSQKLLDKMNSVTNRHFWQLHHGTSEEFEEMREAVEEYQRFQQELINRIKEANKPEHIDDPDFAQKSYVNDRDLVKLSKLSKEMELKADAYLQKKGNEEEITNPYTKSRVQVAKMVKEFGKKGSEISKEEKESAHKNEARADERFGRAINKQLDEQQKNEINLIQ